VSKIEIKKDYYQDGSIQSECYYLSGEAHREDGPAAIHYYQDGSIKNEYYYLSGKRHRENGPAIIDYYQDGSIKREYYCLSGKTATKEQIEEIEFNKQFDLEITEVLSE